MGFADYLWPVERRALPNLPPLLQRNLACAFTNDDDQTPPRIELADPLTASCAMTPSGG